MIYESWDDIEWQIDDLYEHVFYPASPTTTTFRDVVLNLQAIRHSITPESSDDDIFHAAACVVGQTTANTELSLQPYY